ncbi:MAG: serine/threonine-protein kinase, partial [Saprospiraceae bacterium]
MELKPGIKIHGYTLDSFINSGATAEVWRIKDEFGNEKALKIFSPVQKVDEATLDVLIDEFKLLYKLDHPNILKSEIMGAFQKVPYIIMPYYNGNLAAEMTSRSHQAQASPLFNSWFSEGECLILMEQIGSGLAYLHQEGIIHQDVKPENILFDTTADPRRYVLTDFGISTKIKENIARMTLPRQQTYALTPAYAAPEQFNSRTEAKSDVFSLGVLLFEMCEGRLPFSRHGYMANSNGNIRLPEFRNLTLSPSFRNIVLSALAENPKHRPTAQDLEDFAIRARGNSITIADSASVRTDKITVIQPTETRSSLETHISHNKDEDNNRVSYPPTIKVNSGIIREEQSRKYATVSDSSHGKSRRMKSGRIAFYAGALVVIVGFLYGYIMYRQARENEMLKVANEYFQSGNMNEANSLFSKLAERHGDELYYVKKILTDRILAEKYDN